MEEISIKGPRKNYFLFSAPRCASDLDWAIEGNRRRSLAYVENFQIEPEPKMWCRWDAKSGSNFCAGPKDQERDRIEHQRPAPKSSEWSGIKATGLPVFFILVFLLTILGALTGYLKQDVIRISDWLINYQAGFVRRGLTGELILRLSDVSGLNPGVWVVIFQLTSYFVFFLFSCLLLRKERNRVRFFLLVFSPFIFTFQLNDLQGGYRKEILYFAVLAIVVWAGRSLSDGAFRRIYFLSMAIFPLLILSHEMLAVFLPWMSVVYFLRFGVNRRIVLLHALILLPSVVAFVFCILYPGADLQLGLIARAVTSRGFVISSGSGLEFLHWDFETGMRSVGEHIRAQNFLKSYSLVLLLSAIAFIPLRARIGRLFSRHEVLPVLLSSLLGTILLGAVAADWGRLIYIQLVSFFLILLAVGGQEKAFVIRGGLKAWVLPALLYLLAWHIPHFGGAVIARSFGDTTIGAPIRSLKKLEHLARARGLSNRHR